MARQTAFDAAKGELERLTGAAATVDVASLPAAPGAYLVLIDLTEPTALPLAKVERTHLSSGLYVYAGSARGPGGIRARVARHLRRGKKRHWHVDHLTEAAAALAAIPVPGGNECALVQTLVESGGYETPLPGFGSTDCRHCASHLLKAL